MRFAVVLLVALAGASGAPAAHTLHPFPRFTTPGCTRDDFSSGGQPVRAELCRATRDPGGGGRAVVVLHGCGGFDTFDHRLAADLPGDGITTLYVQYFDPTPPPPGGKGFCGGRGFGPDPFPVWQRVVVDAAAALRRTPGIDPHAVGVVGWSLGAGLALGVAESSPHTFDALAAFSAGVFGAVLADARQLPPLLFLVGTRDAFPVADAVALRNAARSAHVPTALYVYPRGTHNWPRAQGTAGIARAARFLRLYL
jgi:dienelactone hydrolase